MTAEMDKQVVLQLGLVVAALAAVGALAGVVWQWLWTPTIGVVVDHHWSAGDAIGLQHEFSGTGWYVIVALVAGLVAGIAVALLADRVPLLTLAAVVVGSGLAAWLMLVVGTALGPPDPDVAARTADDGTRLPMQLSVTGYSPWGALPSGALLGLLFVFIGLSPRQQASSVETPPNDVAAE
ncbi:hypothetical protein GCM10023350_50880 [Nocardioides endophyticus]|uniref:DUF2567 domain-containing protein n=1 Tax=Nocardioides endophyticus TaxID=1353775 RepID=A0ABP8ZK82_9ACTN